MQAAPARLSLDTIDPEKIQSATTDDLFSWIAPMMTNTPDEEHFWTQGGDIRVYRRKNPNKQIKKPQFLATFVIDVSPEKADPLVNLTKNRLAWDKFIANFVELNPGKEEDEKGKKDKK